MIPPILIYLLKANIALSMFYLVYRLGLRRLTFYTLNRLFLMFGIVFSAIYPFIAVDDFINRHERLTGTVILYIPDFSSWQAAEPTFNAWMLLVYVFWIGAGMMVIRLAVQLRSLWMLHRKSQTENVGGTTVKLLKEAINPFSFFNNIYINPSLHQPEELQAILFHESVHVKQWHTLDVMIGEINNVFYWFNPGAWLMKSAIRENLEFITDRYLINQGVDKVAYQYNLIKVSGIPSATAIANNFNLSHLKNRILMINSKRSSRYHLIRYLVLGSLAGGLVLLLNYSKASTIVPYNFVPEPIKNTITLFKPVKDTNKVPKPDSNKLIIHVSGSGDTPAVYIVDGKLSSKEELSKIDGNQIKVISVVKNEEALKAYGKKYGDKVKNGVIEVFLLKEGETPTPPPAGSIKVKIKDLDSASVLVGGQGPDNSLKNLAGDKLVLINGKLATIEKINYLDSHPDKISTVSILKSEAAVSIYGKAGSNGVILLETKDRGNSITVEGGPQKSN